MIRKLTTLLAACALLVGFGSTASATFTYSKVVDIPFQPDSGSYPRLHFIEFTMTGDSGEAYATGGETPDFADTDMGSVSGAISLSCTSPDGYMAHWTGSKIQLFTPANAEAAHTHTLAVTAGTSGDAVTNNAGVLESTGGEDLTTASGGAITAGTADELANATDLENVVIRCTGIAY